MENLQKSKIFIVDDNASCLFAYSSTIKKLGYQEVFVYQSSTELLNNLDERPKIIFLDYQIDHMTGLELLVKIKRQDPNVFVVLVSGQEDIPVAVSALKYGAFDYLTKEEFTLERIKKLFEKLEQVNAVVEKRKREKKLSASLAAAASVAAMILARPFTQNNGS